MSDLISRQEVVDALLSLTNCKSVRQLRKYTAFRKKPNSWLDGVLVALDIVIAVPAKKEY